MHWSQMKDLKGEMKGDYAAIRLAPCRLLPGQERLQYWQTPDDYVTWFVDPLKARDYTIEVTYSCSDVQAGSDVEVSLGPANDGVDTHAPLSLHVQDRGGWWQVRTESVGQLRLRPGRQTLSVRVKSMAHRAVMNLRQAVLTPVH
jgi:hypothetical protein